MWSCFFRKHDGSWRSKMVIECLSLNNLEMLDYLLYLFCLLIHLTFRSHRTFEHNLRTITQCGNYGNFLSRIFGKTIVKVTILLNTNKLVKSWFNEIFFGKISSNWKSNGVAKLLRPLGSAKVCRNAETTFIPNLTKNFVKNVSFSERLRVRLFHKLRRLSFFANLASRRVFIGSTRRSSLKNLVIYCMLENSGLRFVGSQSEN